MANKLLQTKTARLKEPQDVWSTINTLVFLVVILTFVMSLASTASDAKDVNSTKELGTPKSSEDKYRLGKSLLTGNPGQTQMERAHHWLSQAATDGHAAAQYELAMMIIRGEIAGQDVDIARDWLNRSANQGNSDAMWALAKQYESVRRTSHNKIHAYVWYRLAKEFGHAKAIEASKQAKKGLNPGEQNEAQLVYLRRKRQLQDIEQAQ